MSSLCKVCKRVVPDNAKYCPYCKTEFSGQICSNCGVHVNKGTTTCPNCGLDFHNLEKKPDFTPTPKPKSPKEHSWKDFALGCGAGAIVTLLLCAAIFYPVYQNMEEENDSLTTQLSLLQDIYDNLSLRHSDLSENYSNLYAENYLLNINYSLLIFDYDDLNDSYNTQVQEYNSLLIDYTNLQSDYNDLEANYNDLESDYNNLMDAPDDMCFIVVLYFQTNYYTNSYWLYLEIPVLKYLEYKQMEHYSGYSIFYNEFVDYVKDSYQDEVMDAIVNAVQSKLVSSDEEELANALLSIVQNKLNVEYTGTTTESSTSNDKYGIFYNKSSYAQYPIETLVMHSGECLDTTILFVTLLKNAGFTPAFLFVPNLLFGEHVLGGVPLDNPTHYSSSGYTYFVDNSIKYYTGETTKHYDEEFGVKYYCRIGISGYASASVVVVD